MEIEAKGGEEKNDAYGHTCQLVDLERWATVGTN